MKRKRNKIEPVRPLPPPPSEPPKVVRYGDLLAVWKPPFTPSKCGSVMDSEGIVLDIRGWGRMTGQGTGGMGLSEEKACRLQDRMEEAVCEALNEFFLANAKG